MRGLAGPAAAFWVMLFGLLLEYIEGGRRNESRPKEERVVYADAEGSDLQERAKAILYSPEFDRAFGGLGSSDLHIISWPRSLQDTCKPVADIMHVEAGRRPTRPSPTA